MVEAHKKSLKQQLAAWWHSTKPLFLGKPQRKAKRSWIVTAYVSSGILLGLALFDPRLAVCAWLSIACMSAALSWTEKKLTAFQGALVAQFLAFHIGLEWATQFNQETFGFSTLVAFLFALGQSMTWATPFGITILLGFVVFRKRLAPCFWLPIAWGAGEALRFEIMTVNLGDWLATQWTTEPVLRMLGQIGWWPTHYLCLFAAACIGQAYVTRQRWVLLPSFPIAAVLLLLPALPSPGTELLRGVAAVHTNSTLNLPHVPPPESGPDDRVELIIWPEAHFHLRPMLLEGKKHRGVHLPRSLYQGEAEQLLGVETNFPTVGTQNQVTVLRHDGLVLGSRAKKLLFAFSERRTFGIGRWFVPGSAPALLEVAGRAVIPLICGEFLSRTLMAEGRAAGGELLVVVARDNMMVTDRAKRQLLAVQVMRSVEYHVPSVRASYRGWAYFIAANGQVLAKSGNERDGMLRWDAQHGVRDHDFWGDEIDKPAKPHPRPDIAVLYAKDEPLFQTRCPEGRCSYHALEDLKCADVHASTVIVAGHAAPPNYLSGTAKQVAEAIRCFSPELIVVDTCFGASVELLKELSHLKATIVAPSVLIPTAGLEYLPAFFNSRDPAERARAIVDPPGNELLRWKINKDELSAAIAEVEAMDSAMLGEQLRRRTPPYAGVDLAGAGDVLVPVEPQRVQGIAFPHRNRAIPRARPRNSMGAPNDSP